MSLSLWPTTKERARAMIDFFFTRTKLSVSHMDEEFEIHLSSLVRDSLTMTKVRLLNNGSLLEALGSSSTSPPLLSHPSWDTHATK